MSDKLSTLCNCASSGVSTAAMDKDLGKISPSATCMEVTSSIWLNMPGYSSKHPQVHNSFKIHTKNELLIMMLTLKALLTFSPLETSLGPGEKKVIKCHQFALLPNRNVLENKNVHTKWAWPPDCLWSDERFPMDFCRFKVRLQCKSQAKFAPAWMLCGELNGSLSCSMLASLCSHNPAFQRDTTP